MNEKQTEFTYETSSPSINSTDSTDSTNPPPDIDTFPEGGFGWVVVAGCFIIMACSWGMVNAYGDFQKHYLTLFPNTSQALLSLIGSLESFCIDLSAIPASILISKLGPRNTVFLGAIVISLSFMLTSLCSQLWQLALAQGVLFGIGMSMIILVAYSLPQEWFKKRRATATGIISGGASVGGMLWPLAVQRLLKTVGFAWTNRIFGFIYLPLIAIAALCLRSRAHEIKDIEPESDSCTAEENTEAQDITTSNIKNPNFDTQDDSEASNTNTHKPWLRRHIFHSEFLLEWTVLRDPLFCLILFAVFLANFALFLPFFYLPSFARLLPGVSPNVRDYILTIINGTSLVGRVLPGIIGDRLGRLNTFIVCTALAGTSLLALWLPAHGQGLLLATGIAFSIFSGAYFGLAPAVIGQLFGLHRLKSRMALFMLACAPGALTGSVIGGSFLPTAADSVVGSTEGYPKLIIFSGVMFLAAALVLVVTRCVITTKLWTVV